MGIWDSWGMSTHDASHHSDALQQCSVHRYLHVTSSYFVIAAHALIIACRYGKKAAKNNSATCVLRSVGSVAESALVR